MFKTIFQNWKTTSAGVIAIIGAAVHVGYSAVNHTLTEADCTISLTAIATGIGLICAGDAGAPPSPPKS